MCLKILYFDFSSSENPLIGVVVSLEEKILEKELAEENLKNVRCTDSITVVKFL